MGISLVLLVLFYFFFLMYLTGVYVGWQRCLRAHQLLSTDNIREKKFLWWGYAGAGVLLVLLLAMI